MSRTIFIGSLSRSTSTTDRARSAPSGNCGNVPSGCSTCRTDRNWCVRRTSRPRCVRRPRSAWGSCTGIRPAGSSRSSGRDTTTGSAASPPITGCHCDRERRRNRSDDVKLDASAPTRAVKRTDLTFLRHRARPVRSARSPIAEFVAGRASAHANSRPENRAATAPAPASAPPPAAAPAPAPASSSFDLSAPQQVSAPRAAQPRPQPAPAGSAGSSLDLSEPTAAPRTTPARPHTSGNSLDLSEPSPPPGQPATRSPSSASSTSLDLGGAPVAPPTAATRQPSSSTSLDLGAAPLTRPTPAASRGSTSLDLSPAARPPEPAAPAAGPTPQARKVRPRTGYHPTGRPLARAPHHPGRLDDPDLAVADRHPRPGCSPVSGR